MRMKLLINILVLTVFTIATTVYFIYNKPHRDILHEEPTFSLSLVEMNEEFLADEDAAYKKYFNQVVEISGIAVSINEKENARYDVVLKSQGIVANGELIDTDVQPEKLVEQQVLLKGLFIGYDNLLEEIKLSECSIKQLSTD
jgi:hypothetical protein